MPKLDVLFADFPDTARTLLKRYYGHWRIAPIEQLLSRPDRHYIAAIPHDLRRIIAQHVQDRGEVYCKITNGRTGTYYTVCDVLHRLDSGPAIDSKNLTSYCQYGVSHRTDGIATVRKKDGYIHYYWYQHGQAKRTCNLPPEIIKQLAPSGAVLYCAARWLCQAGQWKDEYIANGEHITIYSGTCGKFIVTTNLATGLCEFAAEQPA